jgi:hypothetical protein
VLISPRRWLKLAETHRSICYKIIKWYSAIVLKLVGIEVEENDEIIRKTAVLCEMQTVVHKARWKSF